MDDSHSGSTGFGLDLVFAQWFFDYPNTGATLGIHAFAFGKPVPVEEYLFYLTGFLAVLLLYVWLGEFWLAAHNVADYPGEARKMRPCAVSSYIAVSGSDLDWRCVVL